MPSPLVRNKITLIAAVVAAVATTAAVTSNLVFWTRQSSFKLDMGLWRFCVDDGRQCRQGACPRLWWRYLCVSHMPILFPAPPPLLKHTLTPLAVTKLESCPSAERDPPDCVVWQEILTCRVFSVAAAFTGAVGIGAAVVLGFGIIKAQYEDRLLVATTALFGGAGVCVCVCVCVCVSVCGWVSLCVCL